MQKFSNYLNDKKIILKKLLARLLEKYPYVSILATDITGRQIVVNNQSTSIQPNASNECGAVIKVYNGTRYFEYAVSEINEQIFEKIISKIDDIASFTSPLPFVEVPLFEEDERQENFNRPPVGKNYDVLEIVPFLKSLVEKGCQITNITMISVSVETMHVSKMFLSSKKELTQNYTWFNLNAYAVSRLDEVTKYAYDGCDGDNLEKLFEKGPNLVEQVCHLANKLLKAKLPEPGIYSVITDPSITGLIAHEAFGHGVEMDMFVKDRAQAKDYIGQYVAAPIVNMYDGASATLSVASYFFDDDGIMASSTPIIENGILKRGISDVLSAVQLKTTPTGNGRRQSYQSKSYTRMTNTFFSPGSSTFDEMIKSISHGYYICTTNNGMEDPKNWGIQCSALYGIEIIDGKLTDNYISPVVMSGHVVELLKSISMISNDCEISGSGYCGKGYKEWVRVSDGGPFLKAQVKIG